ncbi:type II toxin-antitoxin system HicA family toxin [Campylobacter sp.]|uniref:type II toxin-antitoxin system HicA family toxin n=1 Tax=Campylobacter sp. TaxID=205 RepID=UPI00270B977E|nr:type II toxin-antitoxin system HicA family toxin [Campylobacter sp.]
MSKREKLLKELENNPKNVRFETLKNLLESVGYEMFNKGSSHFQFRKVGRDLITIPFKRPIKPIYVKIVIKAVKDE